MRQSPDALLKFDNLVLMYAQCPVADLYTSHCGTHSGRSWSILVQQFDRKSPLSLPESLKLLGNFILPNICKMPV